jgi:hypothetical protein
MYFRQLVVAIEATTIFSAALASMNMMASAVLFETSFGAHGAVADRSERVESAV